MTHAITPELAQQIADAVSTGTGAVDKLDLILSRATRSAAFLAATADAAHTHDFPLMAVDLAGALEALAADLETARTLWAHVGGNPGRKGGAAA
ncbi:hypothetical protein [Plasticicumulans acidivorans]|uniref:Uncharacterized protein n=1 Tax=Plasticicumulans acidivorans TaxID=886464 RepID=A0A317MZ64_9GAMM|nr:hypothetical protein [Plasticicumulans acidivorans]PWV64905.1 hypothetical protein C7443_102559 [Plasticicumulans acidivorans]